MQVPEALPCWVVVFYPIDVVVQLFYSILISFTGGGDDYCGMAMLKAASNSFSAAVFSPRCGVGMDGAGFWSASLRSAAVCVTAYAGDRLGNFFCPCNSSGVSETRSCAVLGMYYVIRQ